MDKTKKRNKVNGIFIYFGVEGKNKLNDGR